MIFDKIYNLKNYHVVSEKLLNFITNLDENTPEGHYEIDEKSYVNVDCYDTKSHDKCFPEAHKKYIDIQIILSGKERLDFENIEKLLIKDEYDSQRDVLFFEIPQNSNTVYLEQGSFVMLYPQDAHRPQMTASDTPQKVKKAVVKILAV